MQINGVGLDSWSFCSISTRFNKRVIAFFPCNKARSFYLCKKKMHELSIALQIAEIIEDESHKAGAHSVSKVELEIGSLSGIEPSALELAVPEAFKNTMMAHAEVVYHYIEARAVCQSCCNEFDPADHFKICPFCNSMETYLLKGKELKIKSFEIIQP